MKIHYTLDDSAARLPLAIRSADAVRDRAVDLRNAPGVRLVEITTQHMSNTGAMLIDELATYFDHDVPSESDPYQLAGCYANRSQLEDLLRDVRDLGPDLTAFDEVEALFPASVEQDINLLLALTTVGFPAFGYVRTYTDSEEDEYHGMVVNLAQARPHLEQTLGQFSLSLLIDVIRDGFFNHQAFRLAYDGYCTAVGRDPEKAVTRLKHALLSRGIAWYLSYRRNLAFYDTVLVATEETLVNCVEVWNKVMRHARGKRLFEEMLDDWLQQQPDWQPDQMCVDVVAYHAVRAVVDRHGDQVLRELIVKGPDYFLKLYKGLGLHQLRV
ncbi:MAG: hypothetical protein JXJ20_07555 [Anaerolineae bacterium]|nr:hypothetical protein [Anaerolineae bacterium]